MIRMRRQLALEALLVTGTGAAWLIVSICGFYDVIFHLPPNLASQLFSIVVFLGGTAFCIHGLKHLVIIIRTSRGGLQTEVGFRVAPHFEGTITEIAGHGRCLIAVETQSKHPIKISIRGPNASQFKPRGWTTVQVARGVHHIQPFHYSGDVSRPWEISIAVTRKKKTEDYLEARCCVEIYGNCTARVLRQASSTSM